LGQAAIELPGSTDHSGCHVEHPLKPVSDGHDDIQKMSNPREKEVD